MKYTFYLISHKDFPELVYIGSTKDLKQRIWYHKCTCFLENDRHYNKKLYKFIRENSIVWNEIIFEVLDEIEFDTRDESLQWEQLLIDQYEPNLNSMPAWVSPIEQKEKRKENRKEWRELNREYIKDYAKKYSEEKYKLNKEQILQRNKEWRELNKEYNRRKINCPICNIELNRNSLTRHIKRKHN